VKNVVKTVYSGRIFWDSYQTFGLEETRMLSVQKGSQNTLEIKSKKFRMLYMWYITLKKDLCSEECRKSCSIKMYSSAKIRGPRRNPDDFRTYKQTIF
jgi:hypothetical protein